jgi:hypothetical protein
MQGMRARSRAAAVLPVLAAVALAGCLGEPEIDERWTILEMVEVTPQPAQTSPGGQPLNVSVTGRITYRDILTGFLVAEVRYSDTISPASVPLDPTENTLEAAQAIDQILANSVTTGRATRAVTGFDHLMQDIDLTFTAAVPPAMYAGGGTAGRGLYLLLYMGEGDEIELANGTDSLVVTPFVSTRYEVLHTGFALRIIPPAP